MSNVICLDTERDKRKPEIEEEDEPIVILTMESGEEYEIVLDDALTPEDFPPPRVEETLFGFSCEIYNHYEERWVMLPQFYKSHDAALAAGTAECINLDFDFDLR